MVQHGAEIERGGPAGPTGPLLLAPEAAVGGRGADVILAKLWKHSDAKPEAKFWRAKVRWNKLDRLHKANPAKAGDSKARG